MGIIILLSIFIIAVVMTVKEIKEGMKAPEVAQTIKENFDALNTEKETVENVGKVKKGVDNANKNTGVSNYPEFSATEDVAVGVVRNYNGLLYRSIVAGANEWNEANWERVSLESLQNEKLTELGSEVGSLEERKTLTVGVAVSAKQNKFHIKKGDSFFVVAESEQGEIISRYRIKVWYADGSSEYIEQYGKVGERREYTTVNDVEYIGFELSSDFVINNGNISFAVASANRYNIEKLFDVTDELSKEINGLEQDSFEIEHKLANTTDKSKVNSNRLNAVEVNLNMVSTISENNESLTSRNRYLFLEDGVMTYAPTINYQIRGVLNDSDKEKFYKVNIVKPSDNTAQVGMVGYANSISSENVVILGGKTEPLTNIDIEVMVPPSKMLLLSVYNTFELSVKEVLKSSDVDVVKQQIEKLSNNISGFSKIIDVSSLAENKGIIVDGKWVLTVGSSTNNKHVVYPVDEGAQSVVLTTKESRHYNSAIAFISNLPTYPIVEQSEVEGLLAYSEIIAPSTEEIKIPVGAKYMYIMTQKQGSDRTPTNLIIQAKSLQSQIDNIKPKVNNRIALTVDASGNGDYTSLHEAMKYCIENTGANFDVKIKEGLYDVGSDWTDEELSNANYPNGFYGTIVPSNVNLIGVGNCKDIIITAKSNSDYTFAETWTHISTLNVHGGSFIKNVTIKAEGGLRYAVHDDFSFSKNKETTYEGCEIIFNDTGAHSSLGCGSHDGQIMNIVNCTIEPSLGWHGHNPATNGSILNVKNSIIGSIHLGEYNTGYEQQINIDNVKCNYLVYDKVVDGIKQWMNVRITNSYMPVISEDEFEYSMTGIDKCISTSNIDIVKGNVVSKVNAFAVAPTTTRKGFYGIALEDIEKTSGRVGCPQWGKILVKGYVSSTLLGLSELSVGDMIGFSDGALGVVNENGIGVVEFIKDSIAYIRIG